MTIKKRIIPLILTNNDSIVYKGQNFNALSRSVGNIINMIKIYNIREVDELIVLDIGGTLNDRIINVDLIKQISKNFFMPICIGGGIKSYDDVASLFINGADRICVNSLIYKDITLLTTISQIFGKQAVIVSIDYKLHEDGEYYCYSNNGSQFQNITVLSMIKTLEKLDAVGEILLTSISHEGKMKGMDIKFLEFYHDKIHIPILFAGGIGTPEHAYEALKYDNVSGIVAGSIFLFSQYTPNDIKKYCKEKQIEMRF